MAGDAQVVDLVAPTMLDLQEVVHVLQVVPVHSLQPDGRETHSNDGGGDVWGGEDAGRARWGAEPGHPAAEVRHGKRPAETWCGTHM